MTQKEKETAYSVGDPGSIPELRIPRWRREWLPTPVFLPGECHEVRSLVSYSPWGHKESDTTLQTKCAVWCCSVTQSWLTLCNLMDCSTPGFPVLHHLPEFAQTHVHSVGDVIQSSHPLFPLFSCPQSSPASGSFPVS